jgi:hypothetical protein
MKLTQAMAMAQTMEMTKLIIESRRDKEGLPSRLRAGLKASLKKKTLPSEMRGSK